MLVLQSQGTSLNPARIAALVPAAALRTGLASSVPHVGRFAHVVRAQAISVRACAAQCVRVGRPGLAEVLGSASGQRAPIRRVAQEVGGLGTLTGCGASIARVGALGRGVDAALGALSASVPIGQSRFSRRPAQTRFSAAHSVPHPRIEALQVAPRCASDAGRSVPRT